MKDARIPCKYGKKCYQQNTAHHQKYKHPPKRQVLLTNIYKLRGIYQQIFSVIGRNRPQTL